MSANSSFFSLLKHAKNYFTADVASKALSLLSIPLFTRMLEPAEYGVYNVYAAYAAIVAVVLTLNAHTSVGRYFYEAENDFKEFFGTSVVVVLGVLSFSSVIMLVFQQSIGSLLGLPVNLVLLLIPYTLVETCYVFFIQIFQPLRESRLIARVNVIRTYAAFCMSVALLLLLKNDKYMAIIWAQLISGGVIAYYLILKMREHFVLNYSFRHLKYICSYSIPLLFYALNGVILNQVDRIMINKYCGANDTGLYSLSYNIAMILSFVLGALLSAWTPNYFENMATKNYSKMRYEMSNILKILACCAIAIVLFGKDLGVVLSAEKYHEGLIILPIVTCGCFFDGIWHLYSRNIAYSKKTIYLAYLGILSSLVNIVLNAIFIPEFGYEAAAYTTLFSFMFMATLSVVVTKYVIRIYPVSIKLVIFPIICISSAVIIFYCLEISDMNIVSKAMVKILSLFSFAALLNISYIKSHLITTMQK